MKLNLACGDDYREGYLNIDLRAGDVIADVARLPLGACCVEQIVAQDILEHIPAARTQAVLAEWYRVLEPNGVLNVRVPDLAQCALGILEDRTDWPLEEWITHVYGGHRWGPDGAYDAHHAGWTHATLKVELEQAGFQVVGWDDGNPDFYTTARKP